MATEKSAFAAGLIINQIPVIPGTTVIPIQVKELTNVFNGKTPELSPREADKSVQAVSPSTWKLIEITIAEVIGTGCLMFFGCMGAGLPPALGAVVFGLVVCTICQIFGHISSAHLNPVITLIAIVLGKVTPFTALFYFVSEIAGAILGFGLLKVVTPCDLWEEMAGNGTGVCATVPVSSLTDAQSLALEFAATAFLSLTVCSVWDARNADKPDSVPLKIAATVTVISMVVGPLTGASMNPVRSLAPALINGNWTKQWIYWIGPISSGFFTTVFYQIIFSKNQLLKSEFAEEVPLTGVTSCSGKAIQNIRQSNCTLTAKPSTTSLTQYTMKQ